LPMLHTWGCQDGQEEEAEMLFRGMSRGGTKDVTFLDFAEVCLRRCLLLWKEQVSENERQVALKELGLTMPHLLEESFPAGGASPQRPAPVVPPPGQKVPPKGSMSETNRLRLHRQRWTSQSHLDFCSPADAKAGAGGQQQRRTKEIAVGSLASANGEGADKWMQQPMAQGEGLYPWQRQPTQQEWMKRAKSQPHLSKAISKNVSLGDGGALLLAAKGGGGPRRLEFADGEVDRGAKLDRDRGGMRKFLALAGGLALGAGKP